MDVNRLEIDKSLKKKLNFLLSEFEASKVLNNGEKPKSFLKKLFS